MKIIIAEDDNYYASYLEYSLKLTGEHEIIKCDNSVSLFKALNGDTSVVILDYNLDHQSGHSNFSKIRKAHPEVEVIVVSGQQDVEIAVDLMNAGAFDYIVKNEDTKNRIVFTINKLLKQLDLKVQLANLKQEVSKKYDFRSTLISNDGSFEKIYGLIHKAASSSINVSIYGKTGTGKELVAKSIHYNSNRKNKPFVAVNLSALSESLIESELFGFERGAFTGANERRIGRFEEANGGTLFLDEISEVSLNIQVKLLRVLQEREITRLGSNTPISVDCRIICASNKILIDEVTSGNFRQDLFYRILGLPIELPELRHRGNDTILLAKHFVIEFCKLNDLPPLQFTDSAFQRLKTYTFPGNVRELKSIIDLACVLVENGIIGEEQIMLNQEVSEMNFTEMELTLKEINERIIRSMLEKYNSNVRLVANKLQIGKSTIYRLLQEDGENKMLA